MSSNPAAPQSGRLRILVTGGGTGGHVYPGLAVAEALQELVPDVELRFVGTRKGLESVLVPRAGYRFTAVSASGVRGLGGKARLFFMLNFGAGLLQSLMLLIFWRPDLVLGTGGYVIGPVMTAARLLRIRCVLQEQNSVPGSANRLVGRWAERIYLGFEAAGTWFRKQKCMTTGNPVRSSFVGSLAGESTDGEWESLGRPGSRVLVFGGSGGAQTLNRALTEAAKSWPLDGGRGLLAQTGPRDVDSVRRAFAHADESLVRVEAYLMEMVAALRWADLVVCRAGAMTLAELQAMGKPSVLVPFPHATDDHQTHNARDCAEAGAAILLPDAECTSAALLEVTEQLLADPEKLRSMGEAAARLARPEAAQQIASDLLRLLGRAAVPRERESGVS